MDYNNILKRSWNIVWNNKFMFVLGFLAALGSGGGSSSSGNSNFDFPSSGSGNGDFNLPPEIGANIEQYWAQFAGLLIVFICAMFILGIVFWIASLIGQTGLISSASRIDAGENVTLREAFSTGVSKLGSMVGLNLLLHGPFIIMGLIMVAIIGATVGTAFLAEVSGAGGNIEGVWGALGGSFVCFGLIGCLLVPLSIVVKIIYPFAQRGLVLYEYGVVDSVKHGWKVVRENIGDVIVLIIMFVIMGFLFGIVAMVVILPIVAIIFLPVILSMINGGSLEIATIIYMIFGGILLGLLGAAVNSIMVAFRSTAVTLAYQEFLNKSGKEALV